MITMFTIPRNSSGFAPNARTRQFTPLFPAEECDVLCVYGHILNSWCDTLHTMMRISVNRRLHIIEGIKPYDCSSISSS
jgi:hypothetical protein